MRQTGSGWMDRIGRVSFPGSMRNTLPRRALAGLLALGGLGLADTPAVAQIAPGSTVQLVLATTPGGAIDTVGRLLAEELSQILKITVVPINRPGAGGAIGATSVANAKPDGSVLCFCHSAPISVLVSQTKLNYDPVKDLVPITRVYNSTWFLTVNQASPIKSIAELAAAAKGQPGKIKYASPAGIGSALHLSGVEFERVAGVQLVHVPYSGSAQVAVDLMNGIVDFAMVSPEFIRTFGTDKLRALAAVGAKRSTLYSEIPTLAESGYPGFDIGSWTGLFAPAATSPATIRQLYEATQEALRRPRLKEAIAQSLEPILDETPEQLAAFVRVDIERFRRLAETALPPTAK